MNYIGSAEDKEVLYKLSEKHDELHRLISPNDLDKINSAGVCKVLGEGEGNNFIDNLYKIKPSLLSPWHITKLFKVLVIIFQKIKSLIK